jgi:His-Xaa-Ser system protein HxsD
MISVDVGVAVVRLPRAVYSIEAVKRASYSLMARYDVSVSLCEDEIVCKLMSAQAGGAVDHAERDFRREVVDQDLRISIELRTEAYRDAILGLAFSKTGLQDG